MIVIGIDCGTQSLKALAWDVETGVRSAASRAYDMIGGLPPGHKEQNPEDWWNALDGCLLELASSGADLARTAAIGVSGQQHGFVAVDSGRRVLRPAKLWCDTSTAAQCRRIVERAGGAQAYFEEIGNLLPPGFTASKILWLKETDPAAYSRLAHILLPHDFLNFRLTGELTAEPGDASGTGYFRVRRREWSRAALKWIDPDRDLAECLPRLIESNQPAGGLRKALAERWGLPGDVAVSSGGGDNMMGAIGSGNVAPGVVTASLGTSGTLYAAASGPVVDPEGDIAAFCGSAGGWLPLACTMNVTVATGAIASGFGFSGVREFDAAAGRVRPGADGLILIPYLEGERLPNVPDGTGVLMGLRPATATPGHLARAAIEGVTMGLRQGLDRLRELGVTASEIRLIGGAAASKVWRSVAADVFGLPVVCLQDSEGAAFGAALQALWCLQGGDIGELVAGHVRLDESTRAEPDPDRRGLYRDLYGLYAETARTLIDSPVFPGHRKFIGRQEDIP